MVKSLLVTLILLGAGATAAQEEDADASNLQTLVPFGASWLYRASPERAPDNWTSPGFDDAVWQQGQAQLGYGDGDEATAVTPNLVSYLFRHRFSVQNPDNISRLVLELLYDDAAIVYLNGQEIYRTSLMPEGTPDRFTTATDHVPVDNLIDEVTLNAAARHLTWGENVIAVRVHNWIRTSTDISFDLQLRAARQEAATTRTAEGTPDGAASATPSGADPASASGTSPVVPIVIAVVVVVAIAIIVPIAMGQKKDGAPSPAPATATKRSSTTGAPKTAPARAYPAPKAPPPKPKAPPPKPPGKS